MAGLGQGFASTRAKLMWTRWVPVPSRHRLDDRIDHFRQGARRGIIIQINHFNSPSTLPPAA